MTVAYDDLMEAFVACLNTTYETGLLDDCLTDAVMYYSRYNPQVVEATIDLEAGVGVYDLPADFVALRYLNYWPITVLSPTNEGNDPSDIVYRSILAQLRVDAVTPYVQVVGKQLVLETVPVADAADTLLQYYGCHALDDDSYATIPTEDDGIIVKLALAELMLRKGADTSLDPDVLEGLFEIRVANVPANINRTVAQLRREVKDKYGGH